MKLVKNVLGVFVLEDGNIVEFREFPDNPVEIAKKVSGECREEAELRDLYPDAELVQMDSEEVGRKADLVDSRKDILKVLKKVSTELTRIRIKEEQSHDQILVQAVRRLSEVEKNCNKSFERLKAWYSLYFPELKNEIEGNEEFVEKVSGVFDRDKLSEETGLTQSSSGLSLDDRDLEILENFAKSTKNLFGEKEELENYIEELSKRLMPNVSAVLGEVLAARVLSQAGSLKKLARMPSSTVQVLGAEKALFRHMKGEGSAPKHGILFLHSTVSSLPEGKRGKMARYLANKTSLASRLDYYNGSFKGDEYRRDVIAKYQELKDT